ncbi:MAG: hypothetical protein HY323_01300 [Betaproteobacteria bacterium]|nr:hypothetical protein [Betaproteobacteria bacterium]MBI3935588.1 hypothetical protein [Betaproteobacteria bacterium]
MAAKTKRSFLEVVVPVADYRDVEQPAARHAPRPASIKGKTVMLLPSGSCSPPFVEALAQRLVAEAGVKRAFVHEPDWPFFHPERAGKIAPEVDKLVRECDLMVVGAAY